MLTLYLSHFYSHIFGPEFSCVCKPALCILGRILELVALLLCYRHTVLLYLEISKDSRRKFLAPRNNSGAYYYVLMLCMLHACMLKSYQLCPTLCNPMDYSLPGSSVHGIFQARILEWVAISFSKGSSQPRDPAHVSYISCIGRSVLYH